MDIKAEIVEVESPSPDALVGPARLGTDVTLTLSGEPEAVAALIRHLHDSTTITLTREGLLLT